MTNLRDYDRDATLIEEVRGLERQLADARASLDIAYLKGLADGRARERARCAQVCSKIAEDVTYQRDSQGAAELCVDAIRNMGDE